MEYPVMYTDRLMLRELTMEDVDVVFRHFADPLVTKFMDIEPCQTKEEAADIIAFHVEDRGCRYGMFHQESGELIGTCGFHCWFEVDGKSKAEIGFDVSSRYWRQGYMFEAVQPLIQFGFENMKLDFIEATVEVENEPSKQLLRKLGFIEHEKLVDGLAYFTLEKKS